VVSLVAVVHFSVIEVLLVLVAIIVPESPTVGAVVSLAALVVVESVALEVRVSSFEQLSRRPIVSRQVIAIAMCFFLLSLLSLAIRHFPLVVSQVIWHFQNGCSTQ